MFNSENTFTLLSNQDFLQDLYLLLIDKGVFGLIIIGVGIFGKMWLEKQRTRSSLENELNKMRVEKIGNCWQVHSKHERLLNEFIEELDRIRAKPEITDPEIHQQLCPKIEELIESQQDVNHVTAENRFWLGEEIYQKALAFNETFPDFCDVFHQGQFQRCKELKFDMQREMLDVDDVLEMLNRKITNKRAVKS